MIREALATLARQPGIGTVLSQAPVARDVVGRLVGGETSEQAVALAGRLADEGYWTSLEWTGPGGEAAGEQLAEQVRAMALAGIAATCELALVPERLDDPEQAASAEAVDAMLGGIAQVAVDAGIDVVLGFSPETDLDRHLALARRWWAEGTDVRLTIPASSRRAEALCRELADRPLRLVKGTRPSPGGTDLRQPIEVDKSFVRCAKALMREGTVLPSFSTHDPRLLDMIEVIAGRAGRSPADYEFTFFVGRQERTSARLLQEGHRVRVYIPFGPDWYGRLVGGLAEQSSSLGAAVRSLLPGA